MDKPLRESLPDHSSRLDPLLAVVGPTGSGKSHLAMHLAEKFRGEIVNCDSVQVFRYFDLGTAKTPVAERRGIPHHLIDALEPDEVFTAGDFSRAGRVILREVTERGNVPIVTGGTGFYLRALIDGLAPGPSRDEELRTRLAAREKKHSGSLHRLLRRFDAATAARIHANDVPKLIRALEICLAARQPAASVFAAGRDALEGCRILKLGLFPPRDQLYSRLESRLEAMFQQGLMEEVEGILAKGFSARSKPFESIGYKQAIQVLRGDLSPKDALFYARRDTRRYAKRQMTWFRQEKDMQLLPGFGDAPETVAAAELRVREFLLG